MWRSIGLMLCGLWLTACTVTELDADGKPILPVDPTAVVGYQNLTLTEVADKLWLAKILPEATAQPLHWQEAKSQRDAMSSGSKKSVFVHFQGTVSGVEINKHKGVMYLEIDGKTVAFQLGRIIKGNAIRDASSFISFDDFKNQVRFAKLSRELNKRAIAGIDAPDSSWIGETVSIVAAVTLSDKGIRDAVPLQVSRGESR